LIRVCYDHCRSLWPLSVVMATLGRYRHCSSCRRVTPLPVDDEQNKRCPIIERGWVMVGRWPRGGPRGARPHVWLGHRHLREPATPFGGCRWGRRRRDHGHNGEGPAPSGSRQPRQGHGPRLPSGSPNEYPRVGRGETDKRGLGAGPMGPDWSVVAAGRSF
jgi:hypothetical protein